MVVDICRQCVAAEVIVISNFLGPEHVGGVVCNPEHGGVLFPDSKFPMMVISFSSFLMQPARYVCSSSSFVCLLKREEWQQGVTAPISIHTNYLSIFNGVSSHGYLNLGLRDRNSKVVLVTHFIY
jgi:hypothetical protein